MFEKVRSVTKMSTLIQQIYIRKMNNEKVEIDISDPEFRNTLYFRMLIVHCSRLPKLPFRSFKKHVEPTY